jgi:AAA family ATP:ADP antiporter
LKQQQASAVDRVLSRLLRPFADVGPGESVSAVVMTFAVFLLLTAYYLLKTAREPLILLHGGAEVKSYASAGQAMLLFLVVYGYSALARRVGRLRLLTIVYLFFTSNLVVFALASRAGLAVGIPFFLWVGVFNYTAIAQFWAFAADVYRPEQGRRLFAILGIGSSVGAVAGARIARSLVVLGPEALMGLAAAILVVCVILYGFIDRRFRVESATRTLPAPEEPLSHEGPFHLIFRDRYLMLVAALTLVLNWCNANGEYILDRTLLASIGEAHARGMSPATFVGAFKADYFAWVNIVGVTVQLFAVSRVLYRFGVRGALAVLPVVAFASYGLVLVAPVLWLIRVAKVAENSLDYSLQNTARQALYLVTSRVEKYVGKTLVDTFLVRVGDVFSALVVWLGSRIGLPTRAFALLNLVLAAVWLALVLSLGKENARRAAETEEQIAAEPTAA